MAINTNIAPQLLTLPSISKIHLSDPEIGKALQDIVDYINANITPTQGDKQPVRATVPGGQGI